MTDIIRRQPREDTERRSPGDDRGRDQSAIVASQGMPRAAGHSQKLGRGNEILFFPGFRRSVALTIP